MITVSQDGSGQYNTIQAALDSIPENNFEEIIVYIKKGIYKEKLSVLKPFLTFIGEDKNETIITYDDYAKKIFPSGEAYRTFNSYTIFIEGNNFTAKI